MQLEDLSDDSINHLFSSSWVCRSAVIQLIQVKLSCARIDTRLLVRFISVPPVFRGHGCLKYALLMTNHRSTKRETEICGIS